MDTAVIDFQPDSNVAGSDEITNPTSAVSTLSTPERAPHPQTVEIIRQIDFYFCDDNLRHDAHLLGLFKEGNGTVSLNEILGFRRMRKFKPKSAVREAIRFSKIVEVTKDNKRLKRRKPPAKPIMVTPKISRDKPRIVVPADKPWLSKGMLKPTGFEQFATDGPLTLDQYNEERNDYNTDNSFTYRIEIAVMKFTSKRKMHQETRLIFEKFMIFGGMDGGQLQFAGGLDNKTMEDMTKKEISERTAKYGVSERVLDGLYGDKDTATTWIVDFEAVAKGFLSSQFLTISNWYDESQIKTATNVLRNFYNYLLLHDVCTEYNDQLLAARKICDLAEEELPKLSVVDRRLPGGFNSACSTLFEGNYAGLHASVGEWVNVDDDMGWADEQAEKVFLTGIFAQGTEDQLARVETASQGGNSIMDALEVISNRNIGLEVVSVKFANGEAKEVYDNEKLANTYIRPMGKLRCKRWEVPHANPVDLPKSATEIDENEDFEFLIEDETLKYCYPGLKMEACVKELNLGIKFIDYFEATYASFFTWLANERIREWKEPGPLKQWMRRQNGEDDCDESVEDKEDEDEADDDEMPD